MKSYNFSPILTVLVAVLALAAPAQTLVFLDPFTTSDGANLAAVNANLSRQTGTLANHYYTNYYGSTESISGNQIVVGSNVGLFGTANFLSMLTTAPTNFTLSFDAANGGNSWISPFLTTTGNTSDPRGTTEFGLLIYSGTGAAVQAYGGTGSAQTLTGLNTGAVPGWNVANMNHYVLFATTATKTNGTYAVYINGVNVGSGIPYNLSASGASGFAGIPGAGIYYAVRNVTGGVCTNDNLQLTIGSAIVLTGTLTNMSTTYGTPSTTQGFTVAGGNLAGAPGNLTVTPPAGFEVSLSSGSGYTNSLSVPYNSPTLAGATVYVRLAATATVSGSPHAGNLTVSGGGAATQTIAMAASTVSPATLTVTADNKLRALGAANPPLTYTITGYQNGENAALAGVAGAPNLSTTATNSSPLGTYPITCGTGTLSAANYTFTAVNGTLTVVGNLTWAAGTGVWDIGVTANWTNAAFGSAAAYGDGVPIVFDDTPAGSGPFTVTLNTNVSPGAVTFSNASKAYTLSGIGGIGGTNGLTLAGGGNVTLATINPYTGNTAVNAGELIGTTGGSCPNSAVTVSSGATNGVQVLAANGRWACGALTYSAGTTYADFNFSGLAPGATTAPLQVVGALAFTGTPVVTLRNLGVVTNGVYPLISYGSFSGAPPSTFASANMTGSISNDTVHNVLDLVVTNGNSTPLVWAVGNGNWDIAATANWKNTNGTAGLSYFDGDPVTFDDTASGSSPILVNNAVPVSPVSVTANLTNKNYVISGGAIAGSASLTKNGPGTLTLSGANTYTGPTTVNAGELDFNNWGGTGLGAITVAGLPNATLGVSGSATYNLGANQMMVGGGNTNNGTINQTGGTVAFTSGNALLVGNGLGGAGTYNLSGGTLSCSASASRGVMIGVNSTNNGTFNLSGTGNLFLPISELAVGRNDAAVTDCNATFNQTGGTATVGYLCVGGQNGSLRTTATFSLTGGSFMATNFQNLAAAASSSATITLGGSVQVTLPAFPAAAGTVNLTFDFGSGWLAPYSAGTAYLQGLTAAYLTTNGANFNVAGGNDITVAQVLQNAPSQNGVLRKSGAGVLTLSGNNTYSGATMIGGGTLKLAGGSVPSSPAAYYPLNGNLTDTSGNNHTGTGVGSPTFTTGQFGRQAITFNGTSQAVTVPYSATLPASAYTVSFWAKVASYAGSTPTFFATRLGGDNTFDIQVTATGGLHGDIGTGSGGTWLTTAADAAVVLGLNAWNMITYTVNSLGYTIYVNGNAVASGTYSGTPSFMRTTSTLTLGENIAGNYLTGSMQDVGIWNTALNSAQVLALYNSYSAAVALPSTTDVNLTAAGAVLDLSGTTQTIGSLAGVAGSVVTNGNLTAGGDGASTTFAGVIAGAGTLTKTGTGTFTLSGANTFTGGTIVSNGTLRLTSSAGLSIYTSVYLSTGAGALNLAFTGTNTVAALYLNGIQQSNGVYGAATPPITGAGYLRVQPPDSVGDGIPDWWRAQYFGGNGQTTNALSAASADPDGDGLKNLLEYQNGTNPTNADTDGDGLSDGDEVLIYHTNPLLTDTDGDGVGDWYETFATFTDPNNQNSKPAIPYPLPGPNSKSPTTNKPVKVFILSGQSNMVGEGDASPLGTVGTLLTTVKQLNRFPDLVDANGNWVVWSNVYYRGVISAIGNGPLTVGQGASSTQFGPELGLGRVLGYSLNDPVLIIKTSIGNRSLFWDCLPPGSPPYTNGSTVYAGYGQGPNSWTVGGGPSPYIWYAGKEYDDYFLANGDMGAPAWTSGAAYGGSYQVKDHGATYLCTMAHTSSADTEPGVGASWTSYWQVYSIVNVTTVLDNFAAQYPQWASRGFQIAGFGWWQGYSDVVGGSVSANRYEINLVNLIKTVRQYYINRYPNNCPTNVPFVVADMDYYGWATTNGSYGTYLTVDNAQLAVGNPAIHPEFAGIVKSVETRDYWRSNGPNMGQDYHEWHNAEDYMLVGDVMGRGMVSMISAEPSSASLTSLTTSAGTLAPAFFSTVYSYTASVPYATTNLTLTPTAGNPGATIKVNGATVASGAATGPIALSVGTNVITTVVVSQDATATNTYTLAVTRAASVTLTPPVLSGYGPLTGASFPLTFSGPGGQSYHVLISTNLALPLANWTVLSTGTFSGSPVNYTDTGASNQQRFYLIQSP